MAVAVVGDLFNFKKNCKTAMEEWKWTLINQGIPSQDAIQAKTCERIMKYMKPDIPPAQDPDVTEIVAEYENLIMKEMDARYKFIKESNRFL